MNRFAARDAVKRLFDILLSTVGLLISAPLWFIISLAIFVEDRGPIFFLQKRCGRRGEFFNNIKFRTMKVPKEGPHMIVDIEHDPRVTRVGRLLRAMALDELPALINILKGDMSLVGPRAQPYARQDDQDSRYRTIEEVPGYHLRSQVRPGLTGLAQTCAARDIDLRHKFRIDNLYVRKMSFWLDVKLILVSLWITLSGKWGKLGKNHRDRVHNDRH